MGREKQLKILIADDSSSARQRIKEILSVRNFDICEAGSGEHALECVAYYRPNIILMDAYMPEMDGIECLRRIRENNKNEQIRVIMMVGACGFDVREAAFKIGCSDFVSRPLDSLEMLYKIDRLERFIRISQTAEATKKTMARVTRPIIKKK